MLPQLSDRVKASLLLWLFFGHGAARTLLADGDTGWHIRTGQYVLENWAFPRVDLFSFTMEGKSWFAWEWFSDVLLALAYEAAELKGVVLLAGVVIAATAAALLRYMLWLGVNVLLAVFFLMIADACRDGPLAGAPPWGKAASPFGCSRRTPHAAGFISFCGPRTLTAGSWLMAVGVYAVGVGLEPTHDRSSGV